MNKLTSKIALILLTILGINIVSILPSQSHPFSGMGNELMSQTRQETSVNVDFDDLKQPHILKVSSSNNAYLSGNIKLNGKTIANLAGNGKEINLSPYLRKGANIIDISGQYSPIHATIEIEFSAPSTNLSQQTSGKGTLEQRIIVQVD